MEFHLEFPSPTLPGSEYFVLALIASVGLFSSINGALGQALQGLNSAGAAVPGKFVDVTERVGIRFHHRAASLSFRASRLGEVAASWLHCLPATVRVMQRSITKKDPPIHRLLDLSIEQSVRARKSALGRSVLSMALRVGILFFDRGVGLEHADCISQHGRNNDYLNVDIVSSWNYSRIPNSRRWATVRPSNARWY
jgi:hypothetical protein